MGENTWAALVKAGRGAEEGGIRTNPIYDFVQAAVITNQLDEKHPVT